MATVAITGLVALSAASRQQDDVLPIVDVHDFTQGPTGSTKKITVANLFTNVSVTGTLGATGTATFGGNVNLTANGAEVSTTTGGITTTRLKTDGTGGLLSVDGNNPLRLRTNGVDRLTISGAGAATFSGAATAATLTSLGGVAAGGALTGATTGAFSGAVSMTALTATTGSFSGAVSGSSFSGAGTSLTALNASNLGSGTVPSARMTGAYTGITGLGTLATLTVTAAINADLAGNADTATSAATLTTARTINGVSFNGSANITVPAAAGTLTGATLAAGVTASSLTSVGTLTALTVSGITTVGSVKGGGGTPTVTPPLGNGTCTVTGTDTAGFINWTVATTTSAAFSITLTFNSALAANPYALISLGGGSLASAPILYAFGSTTGISISGQAAAGAPFVSGTVYQFVYHVIS